MIDNLTNNPRRREPLHTQWWVPDSKEMLEKKDTEYLVPVRKLNVVQKAMFKKIVKDAITISKSKLFSIPYICKDIFLDGESAIALITKPVFYGSIGACYAGVFNGWIDYPSTALAQKFLSTLEKNVAYENPFYQETK